MKARSGFIKDATTEFLEALNREILEWQEAVVAQLAYRHADQAEPVPSPGGRPLAPGDTVEAQSPWGGQLGCVEKVDLTSKYAYYVSFKKGGAGWFKFDELTLAVTP
jgi:hypothetical protein